MTNKNLKLGIWEIRRSAYSRLLALSRMKTTGTDVFNLEQQKYAH